MSREDPLKAEKDYSATLDEQLPLIERLEYKEAIDKLLVLEKQIRQSLDLPLSKRVMVKIVDVLVAHADWQFLDELVVILTKKHGQLKLLTQTLVQHVIDSLPKVESVETKIKLIDTVRTVTDNKIFVEVERATALKMLSDIYLDKGDLDKATDVLCDLQVETYSLMPFSTKIAYILDQVKLTLQKKDFAQAKILSRKILLKTLRGFDKADEYKATYLGYLLEISKHEHDYATIVQNLLLLIEIPQIQKLPEYKAILTSTVYYIILSPYDNHLLDLIHKIMANASFAKHTEKDVFRLLETFTTDELIHHEVLEKEYRERFGESEVFASEFNRTSLQKRIIEHNLRIVDKFYLCIRLERLAQLLQLSEQETESCVSDLVNKGMISAKMNRPQGLIQFVKRGVGNADVNDVMNGWLHDVEKLLEEVDSIGHLINKEEMMHGIKQTA